MNESTEEDDWFLVPLALVGIAGGTYYHGLEFAVTTIGAVRRTISRLRHELTN